MFSNFDHLGVAIRRIDDALPFYTEIMGGKVTDRYTSDAPGVEVHVAVVAVGGMTVELLEPTNENSPIARFMKIKGPGVHHVAYRVENLDEAIREAKEKGVRFMEETLRTNVRGRRLIYIHLSSRSSAIVELCEYPK
ncbi:VOC family protein [Aneurinibacillus sp. Ricciae_BoGa-3]|uniref:VOC family protein n=1 Tax=Aneurinibacillus sp. Ricciae_BoGa-3 TaxID=3022697 RepID=UPI00234199BF|nr:VOC family protein [Aneurinibacillus sp. Ricciae_BoGa-3]WCK54721.1 VOC family protein [Aneurinibacillus sp. Ricciae_BoGa-3]